MAVLVVPVELGADVGAAVTGRDRDAPPPPVGAAGNLSHRRPHRPDDLARARAEVGARIGVAPSEWHLMRQVHGVDVATVDASMRPGTELRDVDAVVTALPGRVLAVQSADCVPILLAGPGTVAAAHAGRAGVAGNIVANVVAAATALGDHPGRLRAVIGPAIGACCYEVPQSLQEEVASVVPAAAARTTWGTPSLDLPAAVEAQLRAAGVGTIDRAGGCTRCDPTGRWFSHRADPTTGRQLGLVVRSERPGAHLDGAAA